MRRRDLKKTDFLLVFVFSLWLSVVLSLPPLGHSGGTLRPLGSILRFARRGVWLLLERFLGVWLVASSWVIECTSRPGLWRPCYGMVASRRAWARGRFPPLAWRQESLRDGEGPVKGGAPLGYP